MEYKDELDRMRNRKRKARAMSDDDSSPRKRTASRYEGKNTNGRRKKQGKHQEMRLEYEDFSTIKKRAARDGRSAGTKRVAEAAGSSGSLRGNGQKRRNRIQKRKKQKRLLAGILFAALLVIGLYQLLGFKKGSGYWTIAVFGVDSRDGNLEKDTHSDVEMVCVVDRKTGEIRIASVFRDTYMQVSADGKYHKINQAYFDGGHEQAVDALERNLDLRIDDYATFNWKMVADAINILGGIDLEISDSEFKYINGFITETVNSTGLGSHQLEYAGTNHLDGVQAVAYARLRLMDTDYNRTARQRLVLSLAMEKAKQADSKTLLLLVNTVIPQISTSIGISDVIPMAKNIKQYHIGETGGFPFSRTEKNIGKRDCVIPLTLESNVVQLHQFLYPEKSYSPSATVKKISAKIASDSGLGEVAENAPEVRVGNQAGTATQPAETQPATVREETTSVNNVVETTEEATKESPEESSEEMAEETAGGMETIEESTEMSTELYSETIPELEKTEQDMELETDSPGQKEEDSEHQFPTPGV